ncbi:MoxR family ATPase [Candidatus Marsarchaeota archaeon]|nr:MoxR family ATPase [Candidatus Marsarchaeota archaeon]MCL5404318.1 MoxR family ATPase [Candidatus Marsarchaeota archaeon]
MHITNPKDAFEAVVKEIKKKVAGNDEIIKLMFIAVVADGHALLEGVPGLAKTTMTKALSETIEADFARIQGTPDLEFKDVVGFTYLDEKTKNVEVKKGPIFTNILLIDELNRTPQRTATALLEALEEKQVTLGTATMPLERPFITFATQNPLNIEGTSPLPKVLADRFLMRIAVDYARAEDEEQMLRIKENEESTHINRVLSKEDVLSLQKQAKAVNISDEVVKYITSIAQATRKEMHVLMGASPRAEISFMACGKAKALVEGRSDVSIDDIKYLARPVLSHRIVVRSTGGVGANGVIDGIIAMTKLPG